LPRARADPRPQLRHPGGREGPRAARPGAPHRPHVRGGRGRGLQLAARDGDPQPREDPLMAALLTRIRARLTLHTHRRVASLLDGGWASVFHGQSLDFVDLREYVADVEIRHIDWNASSRHSLPLVKRYTDHRQPRLALVVATGRTMDATATGGESKRDLAILLAGMAGWFAVRGGDEVCLVASDGHRTRITRPESSEAGLEHILRRILAHRG